MNNKKRGGRDRPRHRRDNNDIYGDEESGIDPSLVDLEEVEMQAQMQVELRERALISSYLDFLDVVVRPMVGNIQLYWRDIWNEAYLHLKTYIMDKYNNARIEETMDFHDMSIEFIEDIKININDADNTDERGNFAQAYVGELINPRVNRDLYTAFENFRIYLEDLKQQSDNVEFVETETEMRFRIGQGRNSDEALRIIENRGELFEHIIDETEMMLDYEKNVFIFNPDNLNIANFSDEMSEVGNIAQYLDERHSVIPGLDHFDGQLTNLFWSYYSVLEDMIARTLDRMHDTYYSEGGKKKKKKNKRKVKRKSIKKNKKGKRKTKRKIYGRKR